jgi:hypothetical protein
VVKELGAQAVGVSNYGVISDANPEDLTLADANGDGLSDVYVRANTNSNWFFRINTGTDFNAGVSIPLQDFLRQTRFVDVNGDGRADVLHPFNGGGYKAYNVKLAQPDGSYGPKAGCRGYRAATLMPSCASTATATRTASSRSSPTSTATGTSTSCRSRWTTTPTSTSRAATAASRRGTSSRRSSTAWARRPISLTRR